MGPCGLFRVQRSNCTWVLPTTTTKVCDIMWDFTHTSSTLGPLCSEAFPSGIHFQTPLLPHTTITSSQLPVSIHQAPTFHTYVTPFTRSETAATRDSTLHPPVPTTCDLHDIDVKIVPNPS